ncbi:MAG: recombinase family protein [Firmicutes bacterium]|nr:recombinase family protein [Bacillota bacterium]
MARLSKYEASCAAQLVMNNSWRAALYVRLSRDDDDKLESESIGSQKLLLEDFILRHPAIHVHDTYIDDGYTGTNFERPDFSRMMEDIRAQKVTCVIVKDLSRFGRNYVESGKYLETIFPLLKIRFISVNDVIDSFENPASMSNVIIPFKNVMNDEYCRDISTKVRSSLNIKRKQGQFIGSFASYGYCKDPADRHRLIIDDEAAEVVRLIFKSFVEGKSINGIARILNDLGIPGIAEYKKSKGLNYRPGGRVDTTGYWSDFSVRRILTNRVYIGDLVQKKTEIVSYKVQVCRSVERAKQIVVENTHEPIIDRELFDKVQSLLTRDTRTSPHKGELSLFAGFIKCADCGRAMQKKNITQPNKLYNYYVCSTYRKMTNAKCTKHTVRSDALEKAVFAVIQKYIEMAVDMDALIEQINNSPERSVSSNRIGQAIHSAEREKEKIARYITELYPDYKEGILTKEQYLSFKEKYEAQTLGIDTTLQKLREELEREKGGVDGSNTFIENFKRFRNLRTLSREVLVELVNNIYVHEGGGLDIDFRFRDTYAQALEYIDLNKALVASLNDLSALPIQTAI